MKIRRTKKLRLNYTPKTCGQIDNIVEENRALIAHGDQNCVNLATGLKILAQVHGIRVRPFRSSKFRNLKVRAWANCRARILNVDAELLTGLEYNSRLAREVIPHELGHIILGHPSSHFWKYGAPGERILEYEADYFMRRLLAPLRLAKNFRTDSEIQTRFQTTGRTAKIIRQEAEEEFAKRRKVEALILPSSEPITTKPSTPPSLNSLIQSSSPFVFVSMSFREERLKFYLEVIKPAIENAGMISCRIDEIFNTGEIADDIRKAISSSRVLLADVGDRNPNVTHEIGYAQGILKPLILICNRKMNKTVSSNISSIRRILYDDNAPGGHILTRQLASLLRRY